MSKEQKRKRQKSSPNTSQGKPLKLLKDCQPKPYTMPVESSDETMDSSVAVSNIDLMSILQSIKKDTGENKIRLDSAEGNINILSGQYEVIDTSVNSAELSIVVLQNQIKVVTGRLLRAEKTIEKQQSEITDLRARSMRNNFVIKPKVNSYAEKPKENSERTIKDFLNKEMKITSDIKIVRAHRLGPAGKENRSLIGRAVYSGDLHNILSSGKELAGTGHSVSQQYPAEMEERRRFAYPEFKRLRSAEGPKPKWNVEKLINNGKVCSQFLPSPLPASSTVLQGEASKLNIVSSSINEDSGSKFVAFVSKIENISGVRELYDTVVQDNSVADADNLIIGYSTRRLNGGQVDNFNSDGDHGAGLSVLRYLQNKKMSGYAVIIARWAHNGRNNLFQTMNKCIDEAISHLTG